LNNLAVVGMGSIAKRHLSNLRQLHPSAVIYSVSASGSNNTLLENVDSVVSLEELIAIVPDYVIVASPASSHADIAQKLLANNISVLIEKPLADNSPACFALQRFCKKQPEKKVAVGYCLRFLPSAVVVKNYLDQGLLGEIYNIQVNVGQYLPDWRPDINYKESVSANKALGGGVLLELSHELDYLQWLLGDLHLLHSWLRMSDELDLKVEDIANLVLLSKNNVYVTVHLDFIQKSTQRICEIVGQHGRLVWDLVENTVTLYDALGKNTLYSDPLYDKNDMYLALLKEFENLHHGGGHKLSTLTSATRIVQLVDKAKSLNQWRRKV
jgi:predicted dehydrogenase